MCNDSRHIRRKCIRIAFVPKILFGIQRDNIESFRGQRSTEVLAEGIPTSISGNVENKSLWSANRLNFVQGKGMKVSLGKYRYRQGKLNRSHYVSQFHQLSHR